MSAFYPTSAFSPVEVYEQLKGEYAIIIKLHPFCQERFEIPEEYKDVIIDLSDDDELNDLLFVTDLLVTDYSSVVFEASLLNIPMMFYAFDLYDYISSRDFYYDFEGFVPGKIVFCLHTVYSLPPPYFHDWKVLPSFCESVLLHHRTEDNCIDLPG